MPIPDGNDRGNRCAASNENTTRMTARANRSRTADLIMTDRKTRSVTFSTCVPTG
jgi:hypothetical protein